MVRKLLNICVAFGFLSQFSFGQSQIGGATLNGTVTDPLGALVAGAKVTITQGGTGFTRSTETSEAGLYTFA